MGNAPHMAEVLEEFVARSGYTAGQLSKLTGIPKPTIVNWVEGRVRKPRGVEDLLLLALALHLSEEETSRFLTSAGHPPIPNLRITAVSTNNNPLIDLLNRFRSKPLVSNSAPFQAYADVPTFVGRQQVIMQIKSVLLSHRSPRFVSIQGMGGVGKTTLAIHLAHLLRPHFEDGVLWANVSNANPEAILYTFAAAFGVEVDHLIDVEIRSQVVRNLLSNQNVLIILDGVEDSEQLIPLLPPLLRGGVIWTTRRRDLAKARHAVQINLTPFDVEAAESLLLFTAVLGDERIKVERPFFEKIAHLLGHLPLAVDIAAARIAYEPGWTAQTFLEQLSQEKGRLDVLRYENQDVALSLMGMFERLAPELQRSFSSLAVFEGYTFTAEAATAVLEKPLDETQMILRRLYGLSLVTLGAEGVEQQTRYQIHGLIQTYLARRRDDVGIDGRFVDFYLQLAQRHPHNWSLLQQEEPHLHKSLTLASEEQISQLILTLYPYWEATGAYEMAQHWLERGYQLCQQQDVTLLAMMLNLARLHDRLGEYIEAETRYEEALLLGRSLGESLQLSHILRRLGVLASRKSDYVLADAYYKEGIQLSSQLNRGNAVSEFLRGLGVQAYLQGDFSRAEAFYEEGLSLMHLTNEEARQPSGQIGRFWGIGYVALEQGQLDEGLAYIQQALTLAQQIGDRRREVGLLRMMAQLQRQLGDRATAVHSLTKAMMMAREIASRWQEARTLGELAELQLEDKRLIEATSLFEEQFRLGRILGSQELVATARFGMARIAVAEGEVERGERYGRQALDAFTAIGHEAVRQVEAWLIAREKA